MSGVSLRKFQTAATLAALCAVVGCSTLPTEPQNGASDGSTATGLSSTTQPLPAGARSAQSATASMEIDGTLGGVVAAGDFTVVIPPLAISGTASVTVTQPDLSKPVVQLNITPESANEFKLPVTLIANASRMDPKRLAVAYMSYFNPGTRKWEPVQGSKVDLVLRTVQAPLMHFSTYRVESGGKAGW